MRHPVAVVCSHLESVDLELVRLDQAGLSEPVADFVPLIALQLQDLTILGVLYHGAVAGELLKGTGGLVECLYHFWTKEENTNYNINSKFFPLLGNLV